MRFWFSRQRKDYHMKMLLISAAASALLVGTALASPNDDQQDRHKPAMQGNDKTDQKDTTSKADANSDTARNVTVNRDVNVNKDVNVNRNVTVNRDVNVNRNVTVGRQFDSRHRNFDIAVFQRNVRAERHFNVGFYRGPVGYHYRRWVYGQRLPASYFVRDYWLTNYVAFGLMAPPSGLVWVRFGPDAVLIDQFTGEIVQVQYGIFI
jgi:Ni/Co efflux regulator RcnB